MTVFEQQTSCVGSDHCQLSHNHCRSSLYFYLVIDIYCAL